MGLKGLFDRTDASDLESERESLRRQRAEAPRVAREEALNS